MAVRFPTRSTTSIGMLVFLISSLPFIGIDEPCRADEPIGKLHQVYLPESDLEALISRDKRGVLMSRMEFEELFRKASENQKSIPKNLQTAFTGHLQYDGEWIEEHLQLKLTARYQQFVEGWQQISFPMRGVAVESATLDGQPARLGRNGETVTVLSNTEGPHEIVLNLSVSSALVGSDRVVAFTLPSGLPGELQLKIPAGQRLLVNEREVGAGSQETYRLPVGGQGELRLTRTDREGAAQTDTLVFANTAIGLSVAPGELSWQASTSLQVYGQSVDEIEFSVPQSLEIAQVTANGLESWELNDDADERNRTSIRLRFRQPVRGSRSVAIRGVSTVDVDKSWTVPNLVLKNATSQTGRVLIRYPRGVRLVLQQSEGVRQTVYGRTSGRTGDSIALVESVQAFDIWSADFSLEFETQSKKRELQVNVTSIVDIDDSGVDLQTVIGMQPLYAALFDLNIEVPAEWQVNNVTVGSIPVTWRITPDEAGVNNLKVALSTPLAPGAEAQLTLDAHLDLENWPEQSDSAAFALPDLRIADSTVTEGTLMVKAPQQLDLQPVEIEGLEPTFLGLEGERAGFRYQGTEFSGSLEINRKPTRTTATTLSVARLDSDALRIHIESQLEVEGGGTLTLDVQLPESVGEDTRFHLIAAPGHPAELVEQPLLETVNGLTTWRLKFDRRVLGKPVVWTSLEVDREGEGPWDIPRLTIVGADRQDGFTAIEASFEQLLGLVAVDGAQIPLRDVDPVDLPPSMSEYLPDERIVAAYRSVSTDYSVSISETRLDQSSVPIAVCDQLKLDTVVGRSGQLHHKAGLSFRVSGVQSLIARLPEGSELWATMLDGEPIEVHRIGDGQFTIPLSGKGQVARERSLELFYRSNTETGFTGRGQLSQQVPQFAVESGSGEPQPIEILDRTWELSYPNELYLMKSTGSFSPGVELQTQSMLKELTSGLQFRGWETSVTRGAWFLGVAVVIGILAIIGRTTTRTLRGLSATKLVILLAAGLGLLILCAGVLNLSSGRRYASIATMEKNAALEQRDAAMRSESDARSADRSYSPSKAEFESGADDYEDEMMLFGGAKDRDGSGGEPRPMNVSDNTAEGFKAPGEQPTPTSPGAAGLDLVPQQPASGDAGFSGGGSGGQGQMAQQSGNAQQSFETANSDQAAFPIPAPEPRGPQARLSVAMSLPEPGNMQNQTFEYFGNGSGEVGTLEIEYEDSEKAGLMRLAVAGGVVLLMFLLLRKRSLSTRIFFVVLGLAVPMALVNFAPVQWQTILDGVVLGTLCGIALWFIVGVIHLLGFCLGGIRRAFTQVAACLMLTASLLPMQVEAQETAESAAPTDEKLPIYIPYRDGDNPLTSNRVFVPHSTFLKLWTTANPDRKIVRPAPSTGMVSAAAYVAELKTDADSPYVAVTARLVVHNLSDGPITLPLPLHKVGLESATMNGEAAVIRSTLVAVPQPVPQQAPNAPAQQKAPKAQAAKPPMITKQQLQVVIPDSGPHVLDLAFNVVAETTGPAGQFTLELSPTPAALLSFKLPASGLDVQVNQSSNRHRVRRDSDSQSIEVAVDQGGSTRISWQPPQSDNVMDTIIHADSRSKVSVDDRGMTLNNAYSYSVRQGSLSELAFRIPSDLRLEQITGEDVGGWERSDGEDTVELKVFLRRAVTDKTVIGLRFFQPMSISTDDPTSIDVPEITPLRLTRETGQAAVFAPPYLDVRAAPSTTLRQIGLSAFAPMLPDQKPKYGGVVSYEFRVRPWTLKLNVRRRQPTLVGRSQHSALVELHRIRLTSLIDVDLGGAPRSRLAFRMPVDFQPLTVRAPDLADWFISQEGFDELLVLELAKARTGSLQVLIEGVTTRDATDEFCEVDTPLLMDAERVSSTAAIWFDDTFAPQLDEAEGWDSIPSSRLPKQTRDLRSTPAQFAMKCDELETYPIAFILDRKQALLSGESVTVVTVFENAVDLSINLKWQIRNSPSDRFTVTTSEWLKGKLDFRGAGIRQVETEELDDGRLQWTILTQEPQRESFYCLGVASLGAPGDGDNATIDAPSVELEEPDTESDTGYSPLDTQRHIVLLANHSPYETSVADANRVVEVRPDDINITLPSEMVRAATTLARVKDPARPVSWNIRRYEVAPGNPATVSLAELTTVVEHDGSWKTQAEYRTRNRTRQFLPIRLPDGARILSAVVNREPVRPVLTQIKIGEEDVSVALLALPKTSAADLAFPIHLVVAGSIELEGAGDDFSVTGKDLKIPVPQVISVQQNKRFGVPVLQVVWKLYVPDNWDAEPVDDPTLTNLTPGESADAEYFQELAQVKEANELVKLLEQSNSSRQNFRAWGNVNSTWSELSTLESQLQRKSGADSEVADELKRELSRLKSNISTYGTRVRVDEQQGRAVLGESPNAPQGQLDQAEQRLLIDTNNDFFISNNGAVALDDIEEFDAEFNYRSEELRQDLSKPGAKGMDTKTQSAAEKSAEFGEQRNRIRRFGDNLDQLRMQNTANVGKKGQVAEQAEAGQGSQQGVSLFSNQTLSVAPQRVTAGTIVVQENSPPINDPFGVTSNLGGIDNIEVEAAFIAPDQTTTQNLSLNIEIPTRGRLLTMTKVGGNPELTLKIRSSAVKQTGYGLAWSIAWAVAGLILLVALSRGGRRNLARGVGLSMILVSLVMATGISGDLLWMSLVLFAIGMACMMADDRRATA